MTKQPNQTLECVQATSKCCGMPKTPVNFSSHVFIPSLRVSKCVHRGIRSPWVSASALGIPHSEMRALAPRVNNVWYEIMDAVRERDAWPGCSLTAQRNSE